MGSSFTKGLSLSNNYGFMGKNGKSTSPRVSRTRTTSSRKYSRWIRKDLPMVEAELTDVELTELKDIFAMFDKDNSGSIDIKELDAMVSSLGIAATPEDLHDMIQEADLDGSGTIEFSEFKLLIGPHFQKEKPPEDYVEAFKFFDKDGDGFISRTELRHIMNTVDVSLAEADIEEMIKEADANGDGKIDFDEFIKMMQSQ